MKSAEYWLEQIWKSLTGSGGSQAVIVGLNP